jgi:DNA-binding transcriptional ArsR family regulator
MAIATPPTADRSTERTTIAAADEYQAILDAIQDVDCRAILEATGDESLSASELSDRCELPLSTTYRKLDTLTDIGLLAERTRLCPDGKHASEYVRTVDDVRVSTGPDGDFEVTVFRRAVAERTPPFGSTD